MAALRTARRHSDYLIDRARELFPGRTADAKVKAMNFLLPHIRRMPSSITRAEFADDAAQKLGIDSATMRQELKQAAAAKLASVRAHRPQPASEIERVLLRALVQPESDPARQRAAAGLAENPTWYEGLPAAALLESLANAPAPDNPLDAAPDNDACALLAEVLASTHATPEATPGTPVAEVENAFQTLHRRYLERRQRELRAAIAEAERRNDQEMVSKLLQEKLRLTRTLRNLELEPA
jgi:DNA primase